MASKTFCILPWIHMYVNADGSVLPCCIAEHHQHMGNVQQNKIVEIWNDDAYKTMRKKMLAGEQCSQCTACYKTEEEGGWSFRQSITKQFAEYAHYADKTNADGSLDEMNLHYFDVRWSNICNFKCRSCSSTYSSSWAKEDGKDDVFIFAGGKNNDDLYEQFKPHLQNMKEVYFAGGEPLLMDKHYEILEHLIAIGKTDVKLRYNTNLSNLAYKKKSVLDYWKQFSNVTVFASLDSWGERAEYIREGTVWADIEENIKTIQRETPHVRLGVSSVISAFNVGSLVPFIDNITTLMGNDVMLNFYNIINPNYYSFNILPAELLDDIVFKLGLIKYNSTVDQQIKNVIEALKASQYDPTLHYEFIQKTMHYDNLRNKKFSETFPELKELML